MKGGNLTNEQITEIVQKITDLHYDKSVDFNSVCSLQYMKEKYPKNIYFFCAHFYYTFECQI